MAYIGWRFPPLSGGTRQTYTSNDIEGFKGEELIDIWPEKPVKIHWMQSAKI